MVDYKSSLHGFLEDPVSFQGGWADNARRRISERAKRVVRRSPEVMLKITSNAKGAARVASHQSRRGFGAGDGKR